LAGPSPKHTLSRASGRVSITRCSNSSEDEEKHTSSELWIQWKLSSAD
jgi:hypothetical protein